MKKKDIESSPWISGGSTAVSANKKTVYDLGMGLVNTANIISQTGHVSSVVEKCRECRLDGCTDWFLPYYREMVSVQANVYIAGLGDFGGNSFWTSSEADNSQAWLIDMGPSKGTLYKGPKKVKYNVRPVRYFNN